MATGDAALSALHRPCARGGVAAAVGVLAPGVFHESGEGFGNTRGTALAMLVVTLPTLVAAMIGTRLGSLRARIVWLGALAYLLDNAVILAFNRHFLLYVATLSLALWSLVALLMQADAEGIGAHADGSLPARPIAAYLLLTALLWGANWLGQVVPALLANTAPTGLVAIGMPTNPIHVLDIGFTLPLCALAGGGRLWRRRPWAYVLAGLFLVMPTIEAASIATDQLFGHLAVPTQPLVTVQVFAALALVGLIPTVALLRHLRRDRGRTGQDRDGTVSP